MSKIKIALYFILGLLCSQINLMSQEEGISVMQDKVGIGTSNPSEKLEVNGNVALINNHFLINKRSDNSTHRTIGLNGSDHVFVNYSSIFDNKPSSLILGIGEGKALDFRNHENTTLLRVNGTTERIGIGTTDPRSTLHIRSTDDTADVWSGLRLDPAKPVVTRAHHDYHKLSGFRRSGLWLAGSTNGSAYLRSNIMLKDEGIFFGMSDNFIDPETNIKFFVGNDGKIGMGTDAPMSALQINDGSATLNIHKTPVTSLEASTIDITPGLDGSFRIGSMNPTTNGFGGAVIQAYSDNAPSFKGQLYLDAGNSTSAALFFRTGLQTKMKIGKDGKVGIGTTNPQALLDVNGQANATSVNLTRTGSSASILCNRTDGAAMTLGGGASQSSIVFDEASNFEIRKSTRANVVGKIQNSGTNLLHIRGSSGNVGIKTASPSHTLTVDRSAAKPGGGYWSGTSDRRLKKNINDYHEGLEKILALHPVSYQYNGKAGISDTSSTYIGLIAQEVEKIAPYMVSHFNQEKREVDEPKEGWKSVDASAITYMLINAVQEQQKTIDLLKSENQELKDLMLNVLAELNKITEPSELALINFAN